MNSTQLITTFCAIAFLSTPSFAQDGDKLRGKLQELEQQARAAKEAGRPDEAQAIMEKAKRMMIEQREREQGGDKLEMAKRKIEELRKAGKADEAEQLERRVREAGEQRKDGEKRKEGEQPKDGEKRKDGEKVRDGEKQKQKVGDHAVGGDERLQHIAEAVKHLRAAGLNEPAEHIAQMARGGHDQPERRPGAGGGAPQEELQRALQNTQEQTHRALRETNEQTQRALRETHEQMAKMARAIEELRAQVAKRGEGDRRKD